jgi:hypothetical protein
MMSFLRSLFTADAHPTKRERDDIAEKEHELNETRGEYRQAISRVEVGTRLMMWENANKMVAGGRE